MKARRLVWVMALALVFLLGMGTSYAATISILGPTEINKFTNPQFSVDIVINDIGPLDNLDLWQLGLALSPGSGAKFVSASGSTDPDYVFYGDSYDFGYSLLNDYQLTVGDATASKIGKTDVVDKLLATVWIDISNAEVCDLFSIFLFDSSYTFFGEDLDAGGELDFNIVLAQAYNFHVVPIPSAVLLLGSGLVGLIGLRRRIKRA